MSYARENFFLAPGLLLSTAPGGFGADLTAKIRKIGLMPLREGTEVPDFELKDLNGTAYRLSSLKGKVVFVNFRATWCSNYLHCQQKSGRLCWGEGLDHAGCGRFFSDFAELALTQSRATVPLFPKCSSIRL